MYDNKTLDDIHSLMLANIDNEYRKRQGYPTYDLTRGFAFGVKDCWDLAYNTALKLDVENLSGTELDLFISERTGLDRKRATKSKGEITIVNGDGSILKGDLFATVDGVQFVATESKEVHSGDTVNIESVVGGYDKNVGIGEITELPITLQGIYKVTNNTPLTGGYDTETDEDYRNRYYTKLVLIGNDFKPASDDLVNRVQAFIDPKKNGDGSGVATIGAVTTVVKATTKSVNIDIYGLQVSGNMETTKEAIKKNLERYIKTSAFNKDYISLAKIGLVVAETKNVEDYREIRLNNSHNRLTLNNDECGVLNEVNYHD